MPQLSSGPAKLKIHVHTYLDQIYGKYEADFICNLISKIDEKNLIIFFQPDIFQAEIKSQKNLCNLSL